jgi:hypothetical protein
MMGREVRLVPANWQHPKNEHGHYVALYDGKDYDRKVREWDEASAKWQEGLRDDWKGGWRPLDGTEEANTYAEWDGERPNADDYMPRWTEAEARRLMMYETCSEGTPISPDFETPEELARWLADNGASAFGYQTASYEGWLRVAQGGFACSAVAVPGMGIMSGVDAL